MAVIKTWAVAEVRHLERLHRLLQGTAGDMPTTVVMDTPASLSYFKILVSMKYVIGSEFQR